ncbi:MAG TPA: phBC6A51 family helix-turn-helix protein [Spongiibacteraceae bacterium]|jgi:hypothetical protein
MALSSKHMQAALLLASGMQSKDVAEQLGVTQATLCNWKHYEEFEAYKNAILREMFNKQFESLLRLNIAALETLKTLLDTGSENTKLQAAKITLSAAGFFGEANLPYQRTFLTIGPTTMSEVFEQRLEKGDPTCFSI